MSEAERLAKTWYSKIMLRERIVLGNEMAEELKRLSSELEECQAQRRAAFRRIEEQDKELEALKKAMGKPVAWANKSELKSAEVSRQRGGPFDSFAACSEGPTAFHTVPLYALTKDQS